MPRGLSFRGPTTGKPRSRWDRALAVTLVAGLGLLLILGLVFSIAHGSQQITTNATGLHNADETLRSATVARAQIGLAVHMAAVDQAFGTHSGDAIALSVSEARTALADVGVGIGELGTDGLIDQTGVAKTAADFEAVGRETIDLIAEGETDAAQRLSNDRLDARFRTLVAELEAVRDRLAASIAASDALLGRIGDFARFLVAFLIPAAVIFIYRELLRRQQRQSDLENRLEAERQLGRAREEFIANASHELRTPLTGITGLALMLAEDPDISESETASELLDLIISESTDLGRMVEDLLTTARLDAGALHFNFEDVDIGAEAAEVVEPMARAGLMVTGECQPGLVRADRLRVRQVLRNLLSNAKKYGGPNIRIEGYAEGRTYVCSVVDDGPGIPGEVKERLFQRFVHQGNAPAIRGSVGLGLSIVQALAQGMGGSVTHERRGGETRFTVRLPLALEPASEGSPDRDPTEARLPG